MKQELNQSASATFNSSGRASLTLGPDVYGSSWHIIGIAVSTTSTSVTELNMYRDVESPTTLVDNSATGNQDSSDTDITLRTSQKLLFVWTGGTSGAVATATVRGEVETGRTV